MKLNCTVADFVVVMVLLVSGCSSGLQESNNSIDGRYYLGGDEKLWVDITHNNDNEYTLMMAAEGEKSIRLDSASWDEDKKTLRGSITKLYFSSFDYNVWGQWPLSIIFSMDGKLEMPVKGERRTVDVSRYGVIKDIYTSIF